MKFFVAFVVVLLLCRCTEPRVKRYESLLDPKVGTERKDSIDKQLGKPVKCTRSEKGQQCEYRTAAGRNEQVPAAHRQRPSMGPDLSPYEHFDVLQLTYDDFGVLKDWQPVTLQP